MTVLNVWVGKHSALVGCDTRVDSGGKVWHVSKMQALTHASCVLAVNGKLLMLQMMFSALQTHPEYAGRDFDELDATMPKAVDFVAEGMRKAASFGLTPEADLGEQRVALVGWSARRGEMVGTVYKSPSLGSPLERIEITGGGDWLSSWASQRLGVAPVPSGRATMKDVVQRQVRDVHTHDPAAAGSTGGRLIVAELSPHQIVVTDCGELA